MSRTLEKLPMITPTIYYIKQINLCVSERSFNLYKKLREKNGKEITRRLREVVKEEIELMNKEVSK